MSKKSGFIGGALFGAVIGAAAALFVAPKKGSDLREEAMEKYSAFKEDPQGTLEDLRDFSTDKFYDIKNKFDSGEYSADAAKDYLLARRDEIKAKVESGELSVDSVRDFFTETRDKLADRFSNAADDVEEADDGDLSEDYKWTQEPEKTDDK
ncbi:MAG: YtxH domain-containing protein [Streptococcaceae bacterium]|nr:YtxH domain-containing protein [Streptococcaceae bacterium]